jgi:hypothetical protein
MFFTAKDAKLFAKEAKELAWKYILVFTVYMVVLGVRYAPLK